MIQVPASLLRCTLLVQGERRLRGIAIYPIASSINHECLPNVARVDDFDDRDSYSPLNTAVGHYLPSYCPESAVSLVDLQACWHVAGLFSWKAEACSAKWWRLQVQALQ